MVLTDFDSAIDVRDPEKNKKKWSIVGTGGYRTPEVRGGVAGIWHVKSVIIGGITH